jgi:hypothetical protein
VLGPVEGPKIGLVLIHILEGVEFLRGMHWVGTRLPKTLSKTQRLCLNTQVPLPRDIMSDIYARRFGKMPLVSRACEGYIDCLVLRTEAPPLCEIAFR